MDVAGQTDKALLYDSDNDDLGSLNSEEINPSRLLSDLQGVYRDHMMQIENADEERDETYRVNAFINLKCLHSCAWKIVLFYRVVIFDFEHLK
jgi:hypothetical protein